MEYFWNIAGVHLRFPGDKPILISAEFEDSEIFPDKTRNIEFDSMVEFCSL